MIFSKHENNFLQNDRHGILDLDNLQVRLQYWIAILSTPSRVFKQAI